MAAYEAVVRTDHALLCVQQTGAVSVLAQESALAQVGVVPGTVHMFAGQKNARAIIRLERWDARPTEEPAPSEETAEVAFVELVGGGPAIVHGYEGIPFGPDDVPVRRLGGLDLSGIGAARVVVRANGRQRYPLWNANPREYTPEEWTLQFFPDPGSKSRFPDSGGLDRQYAAGPTLVSWGTAAQEWRRAGWRSLIGDVPGFRDLALALQIVDRPITLARLLPLMTWLAAAPAGMPFSELDLLPGLDGPVESARDTARERLEMLAGLVGLPQVRTWAHLSEALDSLGLLVRWGCGDAILIAPSLGPPPAWEDARFAKEQRHQALRSSVMGRAHDAADIAFLHRWSRLNRDRTLDQIDTSAFNHRRGILGTWSDIGPSAKVETLSSGNAVGEVFTIPD